MNKAPRTRNRPKTAVVVVVLFVCAFYPAVCLRILLARQEGLSAAAALRSALSAGALAHWALPVAIPLGLGLLFYSLIVRRTGAVSETATSVGAVRWRRLRLLLTIGTLPFVLFVAGRLLYLLVTGQAPEESDWIFGGMAVLCAAVTATYWVARPAPEYLYALGTGDHSRLRDERAQQVRVRTEAATLSIFVCVLGFGGVIYETLIRGEWPIRSLVEVGLIVLVYGLAFLHWNRKL